MSHVSSEALVVARRQHGAISIDQLTTAGVTPSQRKAMILAGTLDQLHRGVYRFAVVPDSLEQRCAAVCLADPSLVISGPTAGLLLNLRCMPTGLPHAMVYRRGIDLQDVVIHRTNKLHPEYDIVRRDDGIRLLAIPRLVFDLARFLDDHDLESVIEQILHRRLSNIPAIYAAGRRLRRSGRDGSVRFARVIGRRPAWAKPKHSDLEVKLLRALREAGVDLQPQTKVALPDGSPVRLDGGDVIRRFGVEVDHITWHGGFRNVQYDKWRDRQLARVGWLAPRVTDEDLRDRFAETVRELVELYHGRQIA